MVDWVLGWLLELIRVNHLRGGGVHLLLDSNLLLLLLSLLGPLNRLFIAFKLNYEADKQSDSCSVEFRSK